MRKKLKDLTLTEVHDMCQSYHNCTFCPLYQGKEFCCPISNHYFRPDKWQVGTLTKETDI